MKVFKEVGQDVYFKLEPCNVDVQRSYELMKKIEEDGMVELTNKDNTPQLVCIKRDSPKIFCFEGRG